LISYTIYIKLLLPLSFLFLAAYTTAEPGTTFIGASFKETFNDIELTAIVTSFTPPNKKQPKDLTEVETHGLYKVEYSDGDHAQLYYSDLLKRGAVKPDL